MNPNVNYYRIFGNPAHARVLFPDVPSDTESDRQININTAAGTTSYVYGTDFFGDHPTQIAKSLAAAINATTANRDIAPTSDNPVRDHWAMYYGSTVVVVAAVPGAIGNTFQISQSGFNIDATQVSFPDGEGFIGGYDASSNRIVPKSALAYRTVNSADVFPQPSIGASGFTNDSADIPNGTYKLRVVVGNRYGRSLPSNISSITLTADNGLINFSISTYLESAPQAEYVDVYLSADADPKFLVRLTRDQAINGCTVNTDLTVQDGSIAGPIDLHAVGTGLQSGNTAVANFGLVIPDPESVPVIDCAGYEYCDFDVRLNPLGDTAVLDNGAMVIPLFQNTSTGDFFAGAPQVLDFGGTAGRYASLSQRLRVACRGSLGLHLLVLAMPASSQLTLLSQVS